MVMFGEKLYSLIRRENLRLRMNVFLLLFTATQIFCENILFEEEAGGKSLQFTSEVLCTESGLPCKSLAECSAYAVLDDELDVKECQLADDQPGVCCPATVLEDKPIPVSVGESLHLELREIPVLKIDIKDDEVQLSLRNGPNIIQQQIAIEERLIAKSGVALDGNQGNFFAAVSRNTPSFGHFAFFGGDKEVLDLAYQAVAVAEASRRLAEKYKLGPDAGRGLTKFSVARTGLRSACPVAPICNPNAKYRTMDGSCNNLENPLWGMARTQYNRILDAKYADGIWEPRLARDGSSLPPPRFVTTRIISDVDLPRPELSLAVMQWGQYIDHDMTHTPTFSQRNETGIECCTSKGFLLPPQYLHPQCLPIEVPLNDNFFARFGKSCINFVRSAIAPRIDCRMGYSEQMNQITHWMDGSEIYGSSTKQASELRAFQGGRLKVQIDRGVPLPPQQRRNKEDCETDVCFIAGDKRINEQPLLTAMHTIFIREHNRVVAELTRLNPRWNDEQLFQEGRRIVVAELQHITYNEWLQNIVGRKYMETFALYPRRQGYFHGYDPKIDPRINNEFASAAFRFGHSLLPKIFRVLDFFGRSDQSYELSQFFNDPSRLKNPPYLDSLIRGMLEEPSQNFDSSFTAEVTNKLFRGKLFHGLDLVSLNIQRGRDHGLPGYNDYRRECGLPRAYSFQDLHGTMVPAMVDALSRVYKHVDDIDLFIGGVAEIAAPGALLGPVFTCIVGDQFARLRLGDRFFYDIGGQPHSFSPAQLQELRKVSLARILCDNTDGTLSAIQPLAFRLPKGVNRKVPCASYALPRIDLTPWAGEPVP